MLKTISGKKSPVVLKKTLYLTDSVPVRKEVVVRDTVIK